MTTHVSGTGETHRVGPDAFHPGLHGLPGALREPGTVREPGALREPGQAEQWLETGYPDTAGLRLRRAGRTLQRRGPADGDSKLTRHSPAGEVVLAYARSQAATLRALSPMVLRGEPGSVHDMRVAARRLRGTLKSFRKVLGLPATTRLRAELGWLGGVLGETRDNEVLASRLRAELARTPGELVMGPVRARVSAYFAPRAASAAGALQEALDSSRYIALLSDLDQALSGPLPGAMARQPAGDVLPAAVRRARRRLRLRARRAALAPAGRSRESALHETRKAAKDARYAAEAASAAGGKKARRAVRRLKSLQATLGDHHDAVAARDTSRELGVRAHLAGRTRSASGCCTSAASATRSSSRSGRGKNGHDPSGPGTAASPGWHQPGR